MSGYTVAWATDIGRARRRNEDACLVLKWEVSGSDPVLLAVVADGMGGHENGDAAAAICARTMGAETAAALAALPWSEALTEERLAAVLHGAISRCAEQVNHAIAGGYGPMGCTLTCALIWGDRLLVGNIGDSRVYLVHDVMQQITVDHSVVGQLVARGELTPAEARVHPRRNEIFRTIGFGRPAQPDFFALSMQPGDMALLCSDGLHGLVAEEEMMAVLQGPGTVQQRCDALVELANRAGGHDNISVALVHREAGATLAEPLSGRPGTETLPAELPFRQS